MKLSRHVEMRLMRGLRLMADAEKAGRPMPARELGVALGMSETAGLETRQLLLQLGLLIVSPSLKGGKPGTLVSDSGWYALGETPPAPAKPKPSRRCLSCGNDFVPDGPMFVCDPCKDTKDWRAGVTVYDVAHTGSAARRGAA